MALRKTERFGKTSLLKETSFAMQMYAMPMVVNMEQVMWLL
jgi:hypothetical protein